MASPQGYPQLPQIGTKMFLQCRLQRQMKGLSFP